MSKIKVITPTPEEWAVLEKLGLTSNKPTEEGEQYFDVFLIPPESQQKIEAQYGDRAPVAYEWIQECAAEYWMPPDHKSPIAVFNPVHGAEVGEYHPILGLLELVDSEEGLEFWIEQENIDHD